jgi:hypothetical protein
MQSFPIHYLIPYYQGYAEHTKGSGHKGGGRDIRTSRYHADRIGFAWSKDLGPSKVSAYVLSAVANLTSAQMDVPTRRALVLPQLCSPLATPWVSEGFDFSKHRNLIRASTLHCSAKTKELLYSRLLLYSLQGSRHHDSRCRGGSGGVQGAQKLHKLQKRPYQAPERLHGRACSA